jgi:hypothetical protein
MADLSFRAAVRSSGGRVITLPWRLSTHRASNFWSLERNPEDFAGSRTSALKAPLPPPDHRGKARPNRPQPRQGNHGSSRQHERHFHHGAAQPVDRHRPPDGQLPPPVDRPPHLVGRRRRRRPRHQRTPALAGPLARAGPPQRQRRHLLDADRRRLRELAIQSSNGSVNGQDKETLDQEFQNLVNEVDRIGRSTEFSGIKLLDGSATSVTFQVGLGTASGIDQLDVTLSPALSTSLSLNSLDIGSGGATSTAITSIDTAINSVSSLRGTLGAVQNRLAITINNLAISTENLTSAESRIRDVDVAYETAQLTRNNILQQASISVLSQANSQPQSALQLLQG